MTTFEARRVSRTYRQRNVAPPDEVFPLICPVREAEWLDGWTYELIYSQSGLAEMGAVFKSWHPGSDEPASVWVITRHDRAARVVEFVRYVPDRVAVHLAVALSDSGDGATVADITYAWTGLSEAGNRLIDHHHSQEAFEADMDWWERSINHFLETGETLRRA